MNTPTPTLDDPAQPQAVLKYNCDSCFRDISSVLHIQCAQCEEVDLCVECFGNGVVLSTAINHVPSHDYRVIPALSSLCVNRNTQWRGDEEIVLVEALEANGMGNWQEVAEQLPGRTPYDCMEHYMTLYMPSHKQSLLQEYKEQHPIPPSNQMPSHPAVHDISGFMPGRSEFEVEWENDFELNHLKDLVLQESDDPEDYRLKLSILKHYYSIIEERRARRKFSIQGAELTRDFRRALQAERSRSRTEQKILHQLRPFARFLFKASLSSKQKGDFDKLYEGCVAEEELRRRIQVLQEYRRAGLTSLGQVQAYEQDQKHLDLYLKGGGSIMHIMQVPPPPAFVPGTALSTANRKASAPLNISTLEGYELLSEKERHLCSILRLYPRLYLSIKDTLIREYLKHGYLRRAQARSAVKIDVNKTSKLYDFFVSAGWIKPATDGD